MASSPPLLEASLLLAVRVEVVELREEGEDFTKGFTAAVVVETLKGLLATLLEEMNGLETLKRLQAKGLKEALKVFVVMFVVMVDVAV